MLVLEEKRQKLITRKEELEDIIGKLDDQIEAANPVMDASGEALRSVNKADLSEIKTFKNPHTLVKQVAGGVAIALKTDPDWTNSKRLLSDPNLLPLIANYDHDNMDDETADTLENYLNENNITPERVAVTSKGAAGIAGWLRALVNHHKVIQTIKPIMNQREEAKTMLTQTLVELNNLYDYESDIRHAGLQTSFDGKKHIVHYEMQDEDGVPKLRHQVIETDIRVKNRQEDQDELGNYLGANSNYGTQGGIQNESLYLISNEIKKKDQSKKFVLWETNELRNHWDERMVPNSKTKAVEKTNSHQWNHQPSEKPVSVIDTQKTKKKVEPPKLPAEVGDTFKAVPKKDHFLNNVFLQSHLQERLEEESKPKNKAPWSHNTLNKNEKEKKYMVEGRPLFEGKGNHVQNINSGRARIFYSSNVF